MKYFGSVFPSSFYVSMESSKMNKTHFFKCTIQVKINPPELNSGVWIFIPTHGREHKILMQ